MWNDDWWVLNIFVKEIFMLKIFFRKSTTKIFYHFFLKIMLIMFIKLVILNYINSYYIDFTDIRTIKSPLISSQMPLIIMWIVYLYIVYFVRLVAGFRNLWKTGDIFKNYTKTFMHCYNFFQVIANFWIIFNVMRDGGPFAVMETLRVIL